MPDESVITQPQTGPFNGITPDGSDAPISPGGGAPDPNAAPAETMGNLGAAGAAAGAPSQAPPEDNLQDGSPMGQLASQLGLQKEFEASRQRRKQLAQLLAQELSPDALKRYLPKPTAANILQDGLYNMVRANMAMHVGQAPPEPIQQQRLKTALTLQQERMRALTEADAQEKGYATNLLGQANLARQTAYQANELRLREQQNQLRQYQIDTTNQQRSMMLGLRNNAYSNTWQTLESEVPGSELIGRGIANVGDPENPIPISTQPGATYDLKVSRTGERQWYYHLSSALAPKTSAVQTLEVDPVTQKPILVNTQKTTTQTATPGGSSPATPAPVAPVTAPAPSATKPPSVQPPPVGQPKQPRASSTPTPQPPPAVRAFDPANPIDRLAMQVARDSKNLDLIDSRQQKGLPSQKALVVQRMGDLGLDPNNVTGSVRERAINANLVLGHLNEIKSLIDEADRKGAMGVVASNWNRFLTQGAIALHAGPLGTWKFMPGIDPTSDQIFSKLSSNLGFLSTAIAMAHGGLRGGASPEMVEHWEGALMASDPATLKAKLGQAMNWMKGYASMLPSVADIQAKMGVESQPPASGIPAVGTIQKGYRFKGGNPSLPASWERVNQ